MADLVAGGVRPHAQSRRRPIRRKSAISALAYLVLLAIALFFLAPLTWMALASLNPVADLTIRLPNPPSAANYVSVLSSAATQLALLNGLEISVGSALLTIVTATLASYPLSRQNLRFKSVFVYGSLFCSSLPITAILVPVYALFTRLNLVDSLSGTALFLSASSLPFAIWLTKNFMDAVPIELEEAASVDGANMLRSMRHVVLPLMLPGLGVIALFTFILAWGNFYVPFILLLSPEKLPASVTIYQFFGQHGSVSYGPLAAYSAVYSVPVMILYAFVARYLGGAFTLGGAVKG
ncbi:MAG: carbohydrate ABC transporter permease [Candidatus Dormibacteraeota bacterium]|nr:carbohydrate ABC transporter permease [Candidatus Dormibacteraeota bacterium]